MGIGFAVPEQHGPFHHGPAGPAWQEAVRGWLGVSIQELTPELSSQFGVPKDVKGVLVSDVMDDSPAKKAGFERGTDNRE